MRGGRAARAGPDANVPAPGVETAEPAGRNRHSTRAFGPGDATRILPLDMYLTGFVGNQMGMASAIAIVLVVVGMILSLSISKLSGFTRMESQLDGE